MHVQLDTLHKPCFPLLRSSRNFLPEVLWLPKMGRNFSLTHTGKYVGHSCRGSKFISNSCMVNPFFTRNLDSHTLSRSCSESTFAMKYPLPQDRRIFPVRIGRSTHSLNCLYNGFIPKHFPIMLWLSVFILQQLGSLGATAEVAFLINIKNGGAIPPLPRQARRYNSGSVWPAFSDGSQTIYSDIRKGHFGGRSPPVDDISWITEKCLPFDIIFVPNCIYPGFDCWASALPSFAHWTMEFGWFYIYQIHLSIKGLLGVL